MNRLVQPEMLDALAEDDPDAVQSRHDLLKVNWIMGNHRWMLRQLRLEHRPGESICELGAGDGALGRKILAAGICRESELHAVDLAPQPDDWPQKAVWHRGDLFATPLPDCEILVANLFLHHFTPEQLELLGSRLPTATRLILAAEPARYRIHQYSGRLFCALTGLNHVTRYDMQICIRAGFRGDELPRSLLLPAPWLWQARDTLSGANRSVIRR